MDKKSVLSTSNDRIIGIWYALAAFTAWGVLPLYWKVLKLIPAGEILAHRVLWSFIFVSVILFLYGRWNNVKEIISGKYNVFVIFLGALLISANWFIYIWAVNTNHVVEASLGYYINPLFNVILGMVVLREQLNFWQLISLLLAFSGVVIIAAQYGKIPWIALSLALSFGLYGLVKKLVNIDSIVGLALETAFVAPVALVYLILIQAKGTGSFGAVPISIIFLLICSGIVTALPLLWFAQGAKRVPLSTVGFIQYLSPSISLLLGVFIFKEPFTKINFLSFGFIWLALALYSSSQTNIMYNLQPTYFKTITTMDNCINKHVR